MIRSGRKLCLFLPMALLLMLLLFAAMPQTAFAATVDIKYSPLFEASLQNTIREFAEKEAGEYCQSLNDATTEQAASADVGDNKVGQAIQVVASGIPGVPNVPSIPSYTSSYSCGATCGSTCGATCGATCSSTCGSTCVGTSSCAGSSTCAGSSSCAGASTCAGSSTCIGWSTCAGGSTCVGTSTCFSSSCAGSSTCFGTSTCSGATCLGASTCISGCSITPTPRPTPSNPGTSDPLPETPQPAPTNDGSKPSNWAVSQVEEAIEYGFVPDGLQKNYQSNITRQEFCNLLIQFLNAVASADPDYEGLLYESLTESPFTDVDDDAVTWAYYLDIVSGVGDNKFNPAGYITRQEAARMLANLAENVLDMDISAPAAGFSDSGQIAGWAQGSVNFVCQRGIMSGVGNNTFACQSYYTREQAIVTMIRMLDAVVDE